MVLTVFLAGEDVNKTTPWKCEYTNYNLKSAKYTVEIFFLVNF